MKPIKLTLTAYGAFAEKTVLDFKKELNQSDIFVVTGPTGAGKTTIFEAICYALYGESSGNNRKGEDIRSHYVALDGPKTEVEFEFTVKDKQYYIKRYPKQQVPKKRGAGFTEVNGGVEFMDLTKPEDVLTKDSEVKEAIQSIIGLTPDQFRKIVMIPQGEFKEFLMASTSDKEIILRQIFGTDLYKKFQEQLKVEATNLEKDVKDKQKEIEIKLDSFNCLNNLELKELIQAQGRTDLIIDSCESHLKECLADIELVSNEINKLQIDEDKWRNYYETSSKINDQFNKLAIVREKIASLNLQKQHIDIQKDRMNHAKMALEIEFLEHNYDGAVMSLEKVEKQKVVENQALVDLQPKLNEATLNYELVESLSKDLKSKEQQLVQVKSYEVDVKKHNELLKKVVDRETKKQEIQTSIETLKQKVKACEDVVTLMPSQQEALFRVLSALTQNKSELTEAKNLEKNLLVMKSKYEQLTQTQKQLKDAQVIHENKMEVEKVLKEQYQYEASLFMNEAAINLAKKLQVNMPCPVCGSTTHPNIAFSEKVILSEDELEALRVKTEGANQDVVVAFANVSALKTSVSKEVEQLEELSAQLADRLNLTSKLELEDVNEKLVEVSNSLEALLIRSSQLQSEEVALNQWLTEAKVKETEVKTLKEQLETLSATFERNEMELTIAKTQASELQGRIPQTYQVLDVVIKAIQMLENEIKDVTFSIETYQLTYKKYSDESIRLRATLKQLDQNMLEETQKVQHAQTVFTKAVVEKFKDKEAYIQAKLSKLDIQKLDTIIVTYEQDVFAANKNYEELMELLKDQKVVDLTEIVAKINDIVATHAAARDKRTQLEMAHKDNQKLLSSVKQMYALISEKELKYKVIADLAKLANGSSSGQMSFETYVLSSYFDEVLEQANRRLEKMTSKRYYLLRREEVKGNGRKGLDLDVFDTHTSKPRPVKTLSGGESFKASLALALGLSDTVQHHAGGIQLDTMFIDEGFGTLDSESLDQAIDILMDLQDNGRLIGVISHVSELKERIPAKLIVEQTTPGSTAYFKK